MNDETTTLAEGVGPRVKRGQVESASPPIDSIDEPELHHFLVRWDRSPKDGEKIMWFPIFARDKYEAVRFFSMSCDTGNPRPPVSRIAIVRPVGTANPEDSRVVVEARPSLTYTARDL